MIKFYDKIGSLKPKNRIFLAPMADVNDLAFRELCKEAGAGLVYTGMVSPLNKKDLTSDLKDRPAIQLFCTNDKEISDFMKKYDSLVSLWDFNLGCPAKVAKECGFGSFMHNKLGDIEKILKTMRENTNLPITIKLRKSKQALKIAKLAEKYCDAICIHPRTKEQGYSGEADIKFAEQLKKRIKLPIIYSGDVNELNCNDLLNKFDFVMIGREAMGNPNIFSILTGNKEKYEFNDYILLAEKHRIKFKDIKMQAMYFTKKNERAKEMRMKIVRAKTINELKEIFKTK